MPSAKRLVRQEIKASRDYFRDLCKEKKYDEATVMLFAYPETMNLISKKELIFILDEYRKDYMKSLSNVQRVSALEKKMENNKSSFEARGAG